jgi:tRNA(fMet)-specific endonuclease VapC
MEYIFDTNICIYLIKRRSKQVVKHLESVEVGNVGISTITISELNYGVQKSDFPEKNEQALINFLMPFEILEFDYDAAYAYGKIRQKLESQGTPIGAMDMLIGAHAMSSGLTLVTNNEKEFERIEGLRIENWTK